MPECLLLNLNDSLYHQSLLGVSLFSGVSLFLGVSLLFHCEEGTSGSQQVFFSSQKYLYDINLML